MGHSLRFRSVFHGSIQIKTEKAILIDYLSSRASKVTILAYVTKQSLAAEYEVAKKCLEIMDETTTRLSFEFEARLRIILFGMLWLIFFSEILWCRLSISGHMAYYVRISGLFPCYYVRK